MPAKSDTAVVPLFDEFQASSEGDWLRLADSTLKGKPREVLESMTLESIRRRPIYHESDRPDDLCSTGYNLGHSWHISQKLSVSEPDLFNEALMGLLNRGQGEINVELAYEGREGLKIGKLSDLSRAFEGVHADAVGYRFSGAKGLRTLAFFDAWLLRKGVDRKNIWGCLGLDPYGDALGGMSQNRSIARSMDEITVCAQHCSEALPNFRVGLVNSAPLREAGADAVLELAAAMASGLEFVRELCARGLSVSAAASQIAFTHSVGADFFVEIAKARAARFLWARIVTELGGHGVSTRMLLHARTGCYNKTRQQLHMNLVRTTSEALSAVIGGADTISVGTFDEVIGKDSDFSQRIAGNLQLILQEECSLGVSDLTAGSYYVETLTDHVARSAWDIFREIEAAGGYIDALQSGDILRRIDRVHAERIRALSHRETTLVGVNRYSFADPGDVCVAKEAEEFSGLCQRGETSDDGGGEEECGESGEIVQSAVKLASKGATYDQISDWLGGRFEGGLAPEIQPLPRRRMADAYERMTVLVAQHHSSSKPSILPIVWLGELKECLPKIGFIRDFFCVSGVEFNEIGGVEDAATVLAQVSLLECPALVVCAAADVSSKATIGLIKALKREQEQRAIYVAMMPDERETSYRKAGVEEFVYRGSNHYEMNRSVLAQFGVET